MRTSTIIGTGMSRRFVQDGIGVEMNTHTQADSLLADTLWRRATGHTRRDSVELGGLGTVNEFETSRGPSSQRHNVLQLLLLTAGVSCTVFANISGAAAPRIVQLAAKVVY